jgi:spermidine/putrescine transport system permease protein
VSSTGLGSKAANPSRSAPVVRKDVKGLALRTILGLPLALWLVAVFLLPAAILLLYSFWQVKGFQIVHQFSLDNYRTAFGASFLRSLGSSMIIGAAVGVISCVVAFAAAWAVRFRFQRARNAIVLAIVTASAGSYLARIYAWRTILGDNGVINSALKALGITDHSLQWLLFNRFAVIVALTNLYLPYAFLPIYLNLLNLNAEVVEAGRVLGAKPLTNLVRVVIPIVSLGLTVSFIYVFVFATGDFAIPTFLGGPSGLPAAEVIQHQFGSNFNWPLGSAMSFVYMASLALICALVLRPALVKSRRVTR